MNTVTNEEFQLVLDHVDGDFVTAGRITSGALWLDQVDGPWWRHVNLETFDINHAQKCVLGQVVRGECNEQDKHGGVDFWTSVYEDTPDLYEKRGRLVNSAQKYMVQTEVAMALGFHILKEDTPDWSVKMNRGWYALIASRQEAVSTEYPEPQPFNDEEDEDE